MRISVLWLLAFFLTLPANSQSSIVKHRLVAVGDKLSDINFGTILNNNVGVKKLSDCKDRLIIFDFWNLSCTGCIKNFPKMEELQKKFGKKIQIFLVTPDSKKEITKRMNGIEGVKLTLPNLPCIVEDQVLHKLFAPKAVPFHVWIYNDCVKVIGPQYNTYSQKIEEFLQGRKISFLPEPKSYSYNGKIALYNLVGGKLKNGPVEYSGFYTNLYEDIWYNNRRHYEGMIDSSQNTIRNTYVNVDAIELYRIALRDLIKESWKKNLVGIGNMWEGVKLMTSDTTRYTTHNTDFVTTDSTFRKNTLCYEQILSLKVSKKKQKQYLLEDLNRYYGALYGAEGEIERREVLCWAVVRNSDSDKLQTKSKSNSYKYTTVIRNGKTFINYQNTDLADPLSIVFNYLFKDSLTIVIDETNYTDKVDIELPALKEIETIVDIKNALRKYDLDIILVKRQFDFIVIKEKSFPDLRNTSMLK